MNCLPFAACNFSGTKAPNLGCSTDPKSALLELGFLLLETWHGTTWEARFRWSVRSIRYYERLALTLEWQDDDVNPMLGFYAKAVAHCLTGHTGATGRLTGPGLGRYETAQRGLRGSHRSAVECVRGLLDG